MKQILIACTLLALPCLNALAESDVAKLWDKYSQPEIRKPLPPQPEPVVKGEWPVYHARFPAQIRMPLRHREFVPPETVGVEKDCPFPTVKNSVCFECPKCGLKMKTHLLYHFLPHCPKDSWVMNEIEKW